MPRDVALRRGEGFTVSGANAVAVGGGRTSIRLDGSIPLELTCSGSRPPVIDTDRLRTLSASADTAGELIVTSEDGRLAPIGSR
jgi:hypothetical protein